ncbi:hypothetical protein B566_EDAN008482 [Ephemera danica]|nr:hypothetical protein B566_EDAN008482 [Ephemera danica]
MAAHRRSSLVVFALVACVATSAALQPSLNEELSSNEVYSRTLASDSLLSDIMAQCFRGINMEAMTCIRVRVLSYLDQLMGNGSGRQPQYRLSELIDTAAPMPDALPRDTEQEDEPQARSTDAKLDEMITSRVAKLMRTNVLQYQLPETFFQSATLTLKPSTLDLDVQFPPQRATSSRALDEARGILKKKLLLPVLLLLKLKMKALMPILVLIAKIKAIKALIISKIALLVVVGFVFLQLCKKLGGGAAAMMPMMPMPMEAMMTAAPPASTYGAPPAPSMPYSAPAPPTNSYGPADSWEPATAASSNSYSRVWDAHQLAYKAYYNPESTAHSTHTAQTQQQQQASSATQQ